MYRLDKSLYGLKQAPKQWHKKFDHTIIASDFKINECNKCAYVQEFDDSCVIVCLYIDDLLIMGTSKKVIIDTKKMLSSSFDMKDMGKADVMLGIEVKPTSDGYLVIHSHYVEKVLKKFGQMNCQSAVTPFDANSKLRKNLGEAISQLEYS